MNLAGCILHNRQCQEYNPVEMEIGSSCKVFFFWFLICTPLYTIFLSKFLKSAWHVHRGRKIRPPPPNWKLIFEFCLKTLHWCTHADYNYQLNECPRARLREPYHGAVENCRHSWLWKKKTSKWRQGADLKFHLLYLCAFFITCRTEINIF